MASKPEVLISELFLESASNRQTLIRVFNFEIPAGTVHKGGSIFGVIKINSVHPVYERFIDNFLDSIEKFYQEEHGLEFDAEFEKSLQSINKAISDLISREANPVDLSKLNILVAANSEESLSMSAVGEIKTLFFQKQTGKGFQVFDLTKNVTADKEKINAAKLFENVMYGAINPGDVVLIANPELLEDLPQEEIQPVLASHKPEESVKLMRDRLLSENIKGGYTAIIIHYYEEPVLVGTESEKRNFQGSLEHLKATEAETSRYLIGGGGGPSKIISGISGVIGRLIPGGGPKQEEKIAPAPKDIPQMIIKFFVWLGALVTKAAASLWHFLKNTFVFMTNWGGGRKEVIDSYQSDLKGAANRGTSWFNNLGKMNKSVFIAALAIVLVFVWSIVFINYRNNKKEEEKVYNQKVIEITQMKDEAESSLIYGDEERARTLVEDALALAQALPTKKKDQREISQQLIAEIEKIKQQLRHAVYPDDLAKLADLPLSDEGQQIDFRFYLDANPSRYLILSKEKNLFVWQDDAQAWQKVDWENEEITGINALVKSGDEKYLVVDSRPGVSEIDVADLSRKNMGISLSDEQRQFVDVGTWNDNLYALDPEAGQIFRHRRADSEFGAGSAWIDDGSDVSDAVSLSIDGNIWVLKSSGEIYKYYTGSRQSWSAAGIDPAVANPTKIWTADGVDNIYVLEPEGKRLIVIEKETGSLKTQYLLDELDNIKDFYIDRETRKARILADNGIWEFGYGE